MPGFVVRVVSDAGVKVRAVAVVGNEIKVLMLYHP